MKFDKSLLLAPMRGVNCASFRMMCKEYGCDLVSTPMIYTEDLVSNSEKIISRLNLNNSEKPISFQLVGNKNSRESVSLIEEYADVIDINLGCPEKEFLGKKCGSYLLTNKSMREKFVSSIVNSTNKPVTAKIRLGFKENNSIEVAKELENLGVNAITVHGRTTRQGYTGTSDINAILKVKESVNIPVIANGDVFKAGNAKTLFEKTNCDGIMIGRGAMGNPFLFREIKHLITKGKKLDINVNKQRDALKFLKYYSSLDKNSSFTELRQHIMWFTKGLKNASILKQDLLKAKKRLDVERIVNSSKFR